jgi:ParB-like chromosome segregation protein Spo0J
MNIIKMKIKDIVPSDYNPRMISDEALEKLRMSLDKFGYIDPLIVNGRNNHIVGGHQRFKILKEKFKPEEEIEVSIVDMDDYQERACNLALNKINGEWDEESLASLLNDIKLNEPDLMQFTGFEDIELSKIFDSEKEVTDDNFVPPKEPKYKVNIGDIYGLGPYIIKDGKEIEVEILES